jgi:hypothetical protein
MLTPVGCIIANLIAFSAIFAFIDSIFICFFGLLNFENFDLIVILQ